MRSGAVEITVGKATARFTDRTGGLSRGRFESLNLGSAQGDDPELVAGNRRLAVVGAGADAPVAMVQVHGTEIREVGARSGLDAGECDGIVTTERGLPLLAVTADCVPLVLVRGRRLAVVHAGWRGLAAGVVEAAADQLAQAGNEPLEAAIGPSAGRCCYEVSPEVIESFGGDAVADGRMLDLQATAAQILGRLGAESPQVMSSCTICDPDSRFFSHRRDGAPTGRQGVVAWLNS
ncbi:MAG: polyphenol oxidase family protein [Actinomycetes bacterium]